MRLLDIGGGFPGTPESGRLFAEIASVVGGALEDCFPDGDVEVIAEPGRYFASSAMSMCANVIAALRVHGAMDGTGEETPEFMYYLNDGLYGSFNCIVFDHQHPHGRPLFDSETHRNEPDRLSIVWGPTCDSLDCIEKHAMMPRLSVGDWLYYAQMGAYTLAAASTFNGFAKARTYYYIDERTWSLIYGAH